MKYLILLYLLLTSCATVPSGKGKEAEAPGMKRKYWSYLVADPKATKVIISTWDQKAWLLNQKGKVCLVADVSTGIDGRETPAGSYKVLEKLADKRSNLYGRLVDKQSGAVVIEKAWEHKGAIPEGLEYRGIAMPYWMRLTWDGIGMHVGKFEKRVRSSFGCIRVVEQAQPYFYRKSVLGTPVEVVDHSLVTEMYNR